MKKKMTNFKILAEFVKDISSETKDVQTYLFVKDYISKYQLTIDIDSIPTKNKMVEVNTTLKFEDKEANEKKSYYEIVHSTVISISNDVKEKKDLERIILCDVPTAIYPNLETSFLNLIHNSGHPNIKLEKKVDFQKLYSEKFN